MPVMDIEANAVATPVAEIAGHSPTGELANLDLLRAVAVGLVFVFHLALTMGYVGLGDPALCGVLLFFVHTALVLMMSMERLGLSGRSLYTTFFVRRIFRIY